MATTFIPKTSVLRRENTKQTKTIGLFFLVSLLVFMATGAVSGGIFLYQKHLQQEIDKKAFILSEMEENLELELITTLTKLNQKINSAKTILNNHINILPIFELLEKSTLKNVEYSSFNYSFKKDIVELRLIGSAASYETLALQSDVFGELEHLNNPVISNIALNKENKISFTFTTEILSDLILDK
jgi:hypothetical protein